MNEPLRIFIGWDSREPIAFSVLAHSILTRTDHPVAITPLTLRSVSHLYTRDRGPTESTEFSLTRFLVPALCDFQGTALFMDCDMLCRTDISGLWKLAEAEPNKAVHVVQHDYTPKSGTKFLGQPQTAYPRKNWSSLMLFNNRLCTALMPEYVNAASGLDLHRFHWLRGGVFPRMPLVEITPFESNSDKWPLLPEDEWIGSLPLVWNWLDREYSDNPEAKVLHYTLGGPWFKDQPLTAAAELWTDECDRMTHAPEPVT